MIGIRTKLIQTSTTFFCTKKKTAKDEAIEYIKYTCNCLPPSDIKDCISDDIQNHIFSYSEWHSASTCTKRILNNRSKESEKLLFFKGAIYECISNDDLHFSQSQICILLDLPL